ncbi:TraR/DksA C4-type zinc finger protein [Halocynthiibacter styelae]|uniref:TraR/DksA C4-type zinc finger protein n=1 Tax=Halocynthiibacter styelae TaxID=2761955 RepID=A0A8J7IZP7_9RHOB|nr:TraR/DksA C4-type zinc finger protein [Paenihalocynthiibacter styelae]MBI1495385.1 TraR/DksA C4-type zinc finger protein [Paenihalocynthiibacter styelae]
MSERDIERAEARVQQECDASLARNRDVVEAEGTSECIDCGDEIEAARRAAAPFARRCIECQLDHEEVERGHGR